MIAERLLRLAITTKHEPSLSVSRDIDAPAHELFNYLARPADHRSIDGSGMLRGTDDQQVLSGVGNVFEMKMFNDVLGDYVMENHVVEFETDRLALSLRRGGCGPRSRPTHSCTNCTSC
jgi:hypothetical protein